jgi:hypothetical protein
MLDTAMGCAVIKLLPEAVGYVTPDLTITPSVTTGQEGLTHPVPAAVTR